MPSSGKVTGVNLRSLGPLALSMALLGCTSSGMHVPDTPEGRAYAQDFDGEPHAVVPGEVRLLPSVCRDVDTSRDTRTLSANDFV
ncbi:MAG: hypothetical protein ACOC1F_09615, partial [Myxococcota bacterium]